MIYLITLIGLVIAITLIFGGTDFSFSSFEEALVTLLEFVKKKLINKKFN